VFRRYQRRPADVTLYSARAYRSTTRWFVRRSLGGSFYNLTLSTSRHCPRRKRQASTGDDGDDAGLLLMLLLLLLLLPMLPAVSMTLVLAID
jgi:hypothetical protein